MVARLVRDEEVAGSSPAIPTMDFQEVAKKRRMVRNYTGDQIDAAVLDGILETARRVPSAGFSQGQALVAVTDPELKAKLAEIAQEQVYVKAGFDPWVSRSGAVVVVCVSEDAYHRRYAEPDKAGEDSSEMEWPVPYWWVDAGCTMMMLLLAAVDAGLAAGFLGSSGEGYVKLRELLGIPEEFQPIGMVTIGNPAEDRRSGSLKRGWKDSADVIHYNGWRSADSGVAGDV